MDDHVARCHLVASVLAADGRVTPDERAFLNQMMQSLGLDANQQDEVMHFEGADEAIAQVRNLPVESRRIVLDEVVQAALADGKLGALEMAVVQRITAALALDN
ncbi:MAG: hypothetical protein AUK47_01770 [Deltaproteobacteria bacterium CG2_30_63_29]|nr:MAG: hypothetical protein AUK47_01770 [Deltaproteobacteria bacterium CG2_30_63_29]PJB45691.1 MAG: hypothetical protein CO108_06930 [Deltaproteobacteria bacterium CG_4_9_14_3_um_filter_63_12]